MAIGLQSIIARLIGGIPGPIMFGYFIDRTCLYWRQTDGNKIKRFYQVKTLKNGSQNEAISIR